MSNTPCYCCSGKIYEACCLPYLSGQKNAPTAEALMRSRYAAFASQQAPYLVATTHISTRKDHSELDIFEWSVANKWLKLEILQATETTVNFKAFYQDSKGKNRVHHELSSFKKEGDFWFYVDGTFF